MKTINVKAGDRVRVIHKFSNSLQTTYQFEAEPVNAGEELSGIVEINGSNWLFPKPSITQKFLKSNLVEKGMWDTFYSVYVVPDCDVRVTSTGSNSSKMWLYLIIVAAVIAVAVVPILLSAG